MKKAFQGELETLRSLGISTPYKPPVYALDLGNRLKKKYEQERDNNTLTYR
jgi:hypothetical protein